MSMRLHNTDFDFEQWGRCPKCLKYLVLPKTLPCLHTTCVACINLHNGLELAKFRKNHPNADIDTYTITCPICRYPYHLSNGPNEHLTNNWMLQLIYRERLDWWRNYALSKVNWVRTYRPHSSLEKEIIKHADEVKSKCAFASLPQKSEGKGNATNGKDPDGAKTENGAIMNESQGIGPYSAWAKTGYLLATENYHESRPGFQEPVWYFREKQTSFQNEKKADEEIAAERSENIHWPWENELAPFLRPIVRRNLIAHLKWLNQHHIQPLEIQQEAPAGSGSLIEVLDFDLTYGVHDQQCLRPTAFAVNITGNVMVVDNSLCKAVFYKAKGTFFGHKKLQLPVMTCSFLTMCKDFPVERFCAMGRRKDSPKSPGLIFTGPVNSDPATFQLNEQHTLTDVTGYHCLDGVNYICIGKENKCIYKVGKDEQVKDVYAEIVNPGVLRYPTHVTNGLEGEIIISDTGNHRVGIFSGYSYDNFHFIGQYGHNDGEMFWPLGVAVDKRGRLFVCDTNNYRLQVFNPQYEFECVPLKNTFRLGDSIAQDVKPIDCVIDPHDRVLVLLRGRAFCKVKCFQYEHPMWCVYPAAEDPSASSSVRLSSWCCCNRSHAKDRNEYERI